jgi:hypothetical protein
MDEQILRGIGAGLVGGIVVLLIALLKKPLKCPQCGFVFPKFRKPQSTKQAIWGGCTCPQCNTEIDRKGNIVGSAQSTVLSAESPRDKRKSDN